MASFNELNSLVAMQLIKNKVVVLTIQFKVHFQKQEAQQEYNSEVAWILC